MWLTGELICLTGELECVMELLEKKEAECVELVNAHRRSVGEVDEQQKKQATLEETIKQLQSQMKQLNQEVETKSELVCWPAFCHASNKRLLID